MICFLRGKDNIIFNNVQILVRFYTKNTIIFQFLLYLLRG